MQFPKKCRRTDQVIGGYIGFGKDVCVAHLVEVPYEWSGSVQESQRIQIINNEVMYFFKEKLLVSSC
jgi:hypothetical protein